MSEASPRTVPPRAALHHVDDVQHTTPPGTDLRLAILRSELQAMDAPGEHAGEHAGEQAREQPRAVATFAARQHPHITAPPDIVARVAV